jgi:hypothetical protein
MDDTKTNSNINSLSTLVGGLGTMIVGCFVLLGASLNHPIIGFAVGYALVVTGESYFNSRSRSQGTCPPGGTDLQLAERRSLAGGHFLSITGADEPAADGTTLAGRGRARQSNQLLAFFFVVAIGLVFAPNIGISFLGPWLALCGFAVAARNQPTWIELVGLLLMGMLAVGLPYSNEQRLAFVCISTGSLTALTGAVLLVRCRHAAS